MIYGRVFSSRVQSHMNNNNVCHRMREWKKRRIAFGDGGKMGIVEYAITAIRDKWKDKGECLRRSAAFGVFAAVLMRIKYT